MRKQPEQNASLPERIVIFDGVCNLCEFSVRFITQRDSEGRFAFTPAQSPLGTKLLRLHGMETPDLNSVVLVKNGRALERSEAALAIASELDGAWKLLGLFSLVPKGFRDFVYDGIARNRYRWFGKKTHCMLPSPALRARFLENEIPDDAPGDA
ncbi:hypothetical protein CHL67_02290 [Prosthecochloris sp. GSB1]|uniref:thiol-disulfide oxidoreductase DCC family protein n=1 Tax=Prosthecochloris sp. GSB1 TaxID=281093 RepID=UPI000B8CB8F4|nr:thiol-disulfide oxidoreductase DCC family protein [Prosthecochloris sp. GSB1]ASQ89902.1 hypothetical protein CHL67_02290 [Prosthecochloris sp. GSB1]